MDSAKENNITWRADADAVRIFDADELIVIVTARPAITRVIASDLANCQVQANDVFQFRTLRMPAGRYGCIISLTMNGTVIALGKVAERGGSTEWWRVAWRASEVPVNDDSVRAYVGGWYMGTVESCVGNDPDVYALLNRVAIRLQRATGAQAHNPH